jgi:eukaryotic-like serine/threonine-protein kinase
VIDFGIARALEEASELTQTGQVLGTPGWMAPEQIAGAAISPATDVYLWGCLVAYAATGRTGPDISGLDGRLRELVAAALERDPARRPTAKATLLGLLGGSQPDPEAAATRLLERTWVRTAHPTAAGAWPAPANPRLRARRRWYRRKRVLVPLAAVILVIIAANAGGGGRAPAATAAVGQPARDGSFEFLVTAVTCGQEAIGNEVLNRQAQGQYCFVGVSVANVGSEGQTLHTGSQHLYDAAGNRYRSDGGAGFYLDSALGGWIEINPGNSVAGTLVYDVPPSVQPARIELHDSPFSGGVTVEL